ncbi:MAG: hypothetical protein M2R45_00563 [Verrucomicrobia subdivision 3 bacterium]|nr:hypothetical protein [Limisphaerales bacterium]MCS1413559.1 hypothetical protein [Limisphaerales bacterium]
MTLCSEFISPCENFGKLEDAGKRIPAPERRGASTSDAGSGLKGATSPQTHKNHLWKGNIRSTTDRTVSVPVVGSNSGFFKERCRFSQKNRKLELLERCCRSFLLVITISSWGRLGDVINLSKQTGQSVNSLYKLARRLRQKLKHGVLCDLAKDRDDESMIFLNQEALQINPAERKIKVGQ